MRAFRIVLAAAAIVALTTNAGAQLAGQGMANRQNDRPGGAPPPQEKRTPRANDKDYKSSLERLPDPPAAGWERGEAFDPELGEPEFFAFTAEEFFAVPAPESKRGEGEPPR